MAVPACSVGLDELDAERERTLALLAGLSREALERIHSPIMSPLVWDLGHIAAFEDLWLSRRLGGLPLLRPELARTYDAFETPRAARGGVELLGARVARDYLARVRERARGAVERRGPEASARWIELVLRHELQHRETMLQTIELAHLDPSDLPAPAPPTIELAHLDPSDLPAPAPPTIELAHLDPSDLPAPAPPPEEPRREAGSGWVTVPAGPTALGAGPEGFAYDNERPRHLAGLPAFRIARAPVTNGAYRAWIESGGYRDRAAWSAPGWAWKEEHGVQRPAEWTDDGGEWRPGEGWVALDPERPVVHVSWYEADAFARAHGARLPTEAEWERAALGVKGDGANLGGERLGTAPPRGASAAPSGCLALLGDVWEWTSSDFLPYPGFVPDPYRQYSAPFFGPDHKVLRGGSWATARRVATPTFRNWDLPARRQVFAGVRLAAAA